MPLYHQEKEIRSMEFHKCQKCGKPVAFYLLRECDYKKDGTMIVGPCCDKNEPRGPVMFKSPPVGSNYKNHMASKRARIRKRSRT